MPYPCPENIKIISNTPIELILSQEHIYPTSDKYISIFCLFVVLSLLISPFINKEEKEQKVQSINLLTIIVSYVIFGLQLAFLLIIMLGHIELLLNDRHYDNFKITTHFVEYERVIITDIFKTEKTIIDLKNVKQLYLVPPSRDYNRKLVDLYAVNNKNEKIDLKFSWALNDTETILFIVQETEKFLKIKDIPVEGEYKE